MKIKINFMTEIKYKRSSSSIAFVKCNLKIAQLFTLSIGSGVVLSFHLKN